MYEVRFGILVTTVGWEPRFALGIERLLEEHHPQKVLLFVYNQWPDLVEGPLSSAERLCRSHGIDVLVIRLDYSDPTLTWMAVRGAIHENVVSTDSVLVDISTMPREAIWMAFLSLETICESVHYVYTPPEGYSPNWLSRDPGSPRLIHQLGGEMQFGSKTVLLATIGFDPSRLLQLMWTFEPQLTIVGLQVGQQFDNQEKMFAARQQVEKIASLAGASGRDDNGLQFFEVDAFSRDHGRQAVEEQLAKIVESSNVVLSSLGPKLSAVSLYELQRRYPSTCLSYAPSGQYNKDYSYGIAEISHYGKLGG